MTIEELKEAVRKTADARSVAFMAYEHANKEASIARLRLALGEAAALGFTPGVRVRYNGKLGIFRGFTRGAWSPSLDCVVIRKDGSEGTASLGCYSIDNLKLEKPE